jgi:uridine monophosphate synthetase
MLEALGLKCDINTLSDSFIALFFGISASLPPLQKEGLKVTDVVVLIDREQGGEAHLAANGMKLHAAFKLSAMLDVLTKHQLVSEEVAGKVRTFIAENQTKLPAAAAAVSAAPSKPKR